MCRARAFGGDGFTADEITYLGPICSSPGFSTEVLHIYMARGLHRGESHPDEGEFLSVEKHHIDELVSMAMSGELDDGKTVIAVLKAKRILDSKNSYDLLHLLIAIPQALCYNYKPMLLASTKGVTYGKVRHKRWKTASGRG